jgi:hypothetical protein
MFLMRGVYHEQQLLKTFLQSQMFNWQTYDGITKKPKPIKMVQGALRPIELFEYIFPKESLGEVLAMLNIKDSDGNYGNVKGKAHMELMRKMLGARRIPKVEFNGISRFVPKRAVAIHPIGIKDDEMRIVDDRDYQEAL